MVYTAWTDTTFTISERGADGTTVQEHKSYTHPVTGETVMPHVTSGVRGQPLVTNELGQMAATFSLPNSDEMRFPIGRGVFRLTDSISNSRMYGDVQTAGEAIFQAFGQKQVKQERINALRQGMVARDDSLRETRVIRGGNSASASSSASASATATTTAFHGWMDP